MAGKLYAVVCLKSWIPLDEQLPDGDMNECVLLFSPHMHLDWEFPGHSVVISNPVFARQNAMKRGYTHWSRIPYPLPADATMIMDWSNWKHRYYWLPEDEEPEQPRISLRKRLSRLMACIRWSIGK